MARRKPVRRRTFLSGIAAGSGLGLAVPASAASTSDEEEEATTQSEIVNGLTFVLPEEPESPSLVTTTGETTLPPSDYDVDTDRSLAGDPGADDPERNYLDENVEFNLSAIANFSGDAVAGGYSFYDFYHDRDEELVIDELEIPYSFGAQVSAFASLSDGEEESDRSRDGGDASGDSGTEGSDERVETDVPNIVISLASLAFGQISDANGGAGLRFALLRSDPDGTFPDDPDQSDYELISEWAYKESTSGGLINDEESGTITIEDVTLRPDRYYRILAVAATYGGVTLGLGGSGNFGVLDGIDGDRDPLLVDDPEIDVREPL